MMIEVVCFMYKGSILVVSEIFRVQILEKKKNFISLCSGI